MLRALGEYEIEGLRTLIPFHQAILADRAVGQRRDLPRPDRGPQVAQATGVRRPTQRRRPEDEEAPSRRAELHGRGLGQALRRQGDRPARSAAPRALNGAVPQRRGRGRPARRPAAQNAAAGGGGGGGDTLVLADPGHRAQGRRRGRAPRCRRARSSCVIEAMKMENEITAHKAGTIAELPIAVGRLGRKRRHDRRDQLRRASSDRRARRRHAGSRSGHANPRSGQASVANSAHSTRSRADHRPRLERLEVLSGSKCSG